MFLTVVSFAPGTAESEIAAVLTTAGLRRVENPDLLPADRLVMATPTQLRALSVHPLVRAVFPASFELALGVPVHGCGHHEVLPPAGELADGWKSVGETTFTWTVQRATQQLPFERLSDLLNRSTAEWSRHAMLRFSEAASSGGRRNIGVGFHSGDHGDPFPFDGRGGVLAHAFYPAPFNPEPLECDLHLDDDETWSEGGTLDVYSVLLHEIGHSVGLSHSARPGAVMYPYYRQLSSLQPDDIERVQALFGTRIVQVEPAPAPEVPALAISASAPGTTTEAAVTISGAVSGGSGDVQVYWSTAKGGGKAEGGRTFQAHAIPLQTGLNQIQLTAQDAAGAKTERTLNVTRSAPPTQPQTPAPAPPPAPAPSPAPQQPGGTRDTAPPAVRIVSPAGAVMATTASSMRISGTATDNVAVKEVWWTSGSSTGPAEGKENWSFDLPLLKGDNHVMVRARDEAGNTGWRSLLITRR